MDFPFQYLFGKGNYIARYSDRITIKSINVQIPNNPKVRSWTIPEPTLPT